MTYARAALTCIALAVLILAAFVLSGCALTGCNLDDVPQGTLVIHQAQPGDRSGSVRACRDPNAIGCAKWTGLTQRDSCSIYVQRKDPPTLCHEIKHCIKGHFHPAHTSQ